MLSQMTQRTVALVIQLSGVVLLAATSMMMGLQRDTILLQMGALTFVLIWKRVLNPDRVGVPNRARSPNRRCPNSTASADTRQSPRATTAAASAEASVIAVAMITVTKGLALNSTFT
jgi:hypothetical protein